MLSRSVFPLRSRCPSPHSCAGRYVRSLDFGGRVAATRTGLALQIQFIAREGDDRQFAVTVGGKRLLFRAREISRRRVGTAYSRRRGLLASTLVWNLEWLRNIQILVGLVDRA
jgi:hypothetical protein